MIHSDNPGEGSSQAKAVLLKRVYALAAGIIAVSLAGCSMSFPMQSLLAQDTTGSIRPKSSPISADLDAADWRIAEPKLVQALNADNTGATHWSNPDSGRSGAFQPVASQFNRDGHACRAFVARVDGVDHSTTVQAIGCLVASDEVLVDQVQPWKAI
ncbi:MAG TPA: RT0821/Lpp0805 family surface protein [Roseiarcus sp.]|nr:RT0821/Lpp0805 family surface protein [Roseiarcus sp.]